ncbi:MAG: glycosyltransferase family 39 protein [Pyrinomonadaceae bacterium]|nr:glycosyltransferase family 39 protein [Pyrinomonadaceae bacterium]
MTMEPTFEGAAPAEESIVTHSSARSVAIRLIPYILAVFFALWGLRGVTNTDVGVFDSSRHAMNGAFIHDLVVARQFTSPIEFGKFYYSHYPATSLPFHPPLFPAIEAVFFSIFGVNVFTARLTVALAVAVSVVLFYRLVRTTHDSHVISAASVLTFFSFPLSQWVANDVMLEFPSLAFALGALYCLRKIDEGYPLRNGLTFALLAAAAVWTKQTAVFLGLVPFFYVLIARQWRLLRGLTIWLSSFLFGVMVIALATLSLPFGGTGVDQLSTDPDVSLTAFLLWRFFYYMRSMTDWFGLLMAIGIGLAIVLCLVMPRTSKLRVAANDLYLAWAIPAFLLLLRLIPYDLRYLSLVCPALVVIGYAVLFRLSNLAFSSRFAQYLTLGVAALSLALNLNTPVSFLRGPSEAAKHVKSAAPQRVLYCGMTNGSFTFAIRSLESRPATTVIRCDQLPEGTFSPAEFETFAHKYGINYIVMEHTAITPRGWHPYWYQLRDTPTASMVLEREIPLSSSQDDVNGDLRVYRFTNPSPNPEKILKRFIQKLGAKTDLPLVDPR